ncbi:MAG: hypothetical protein RR790_06325 [Eubacterium sp.]
MNASDDRALSEIMKAFIEQPDQYKECGINGRNYFKKYFTKEIHMNQLEDLLNNLVKEAKNV